MEANSAVCVFLDPLSCHIFLLTVGIHLLNFADTRIRSQERVANPETGNKPSQTTW